MPKIRLLLLEDDPIDRELFRMAIDRAPEGVEVELTFAESGEQFRRLVLEETFDCIVMDFLLPTGTAAEILRDVQGELEFTPVLVTSSSREQRIVVESFRYGATDFVTKDDVLSRGGICRAMIAAMDQFHARQGERRREHRRLQQLAETDPLTGLHNRRALDRMLHGKRVKRDRRQRVSCIMADLDHFKKVNDVHGHQAGDEVLRHVAVEMQNSLDPTDMAIRWGGEELLVIRQSASLGEAWLWAERFRRRIESRPARWNGVEIPVTASFGVSSGPSRGICFEVIDQADRALYLAKSQGRNCVCTEDMLAFNKTIASMARDRPGNVEEARLRFLTDNLARFGPTQWEHLTQHSRQVSDAVTLIARRLGLTADYVEKIRVAGLMHDIGKCCIPEDLLGLPRRLLSEEYQLISRHMDLGEQLCHHFGGSEYLRQCVRHHHTWFALPVNGDAELAGDEEYIPFGARILGVADAIVSMRSHRLYAEALDRGSVIKELKINRGGQFAPDVVDVCIGLCEQSCFDETLGVVPRRMAA